MSLARSKNFSPPTARLPVSDLNLPSDPETQTHRPALLLASSSPGPAQFKSASAILKPSFVASRISTAIARPPSARPKSRCKTIRARPRPCDAAANWSLRQPELLRVFDEHHARVRHVHAHSISDVATPALISLARNAVITLSFSRFSSVRAAGRP